MYEFTAVKHQDGEAILDVLANYYKKHNLTLVEERIADRSGKYANSKKWYKDLKEYEADAFPQNKPNFTTNFDLLENLNDINPEWKILFFYDDYPLKSADFDLAVSVNYELSKLLSESLQTQVIQYSDLDTVDFYRIRTYKNGEIIDYLNTSEAIIDDAEGYFENIQDENLYTQVKQYLKSKGINYIDDFAHLTYEGCNRRPLYLKGSPEDIIRFFHYQGKFL